MYFSLSSLLLSTTFYTLLSILLHFDNGPLFLHHHNGMKTGVALADSLSAWQALFVATTGKSWTKCSGNKATPCSCAKVTCDTAKTVIQQINMPSNNMVGSITSQIIGNLVNSGATVLDFSGNGKLKTVAGTCLDATITGCGTKATCTFPPSVIVCTTAPTTPHPTQQPTTPAPTKVGDTASPSRHPTKKPTLAPTKKPSPQPSVAPSKKGATKNPTVKTVAPSDAPVEQPTVPPSNPPISEMPTPAPSISNSTQSPSVVQVPTMKPSTRSPTQPPMFFSSDATGLPLNNMIASVIIIVIAQLAF
jgi:hypothetical protein